MSREHYAWGTLRRAARQFALLGALGCVGLIAILAMLLIFGSGE